MRWGFNIVGFQSIRSDDGYLFQVVLIFIWDVDEVISVDCTRGLFAVVDIISICYFHCYLLTIRTCYCSTCWCTKRGCKVDMRVFIKSHFLACSHSSHWLPNTKSIERVPDVLREISGFTSVSQIKQLPNPIHYEHGWITFQNFSDILD